MAASRLHELSAHGVSVWMDSLSRELLETGELARLDRRALVLELLGLAALGASEHADLAHRPLLEKREEHRGCVGRGTGWAVGHRATIAVPGAGDPLVGPARRPRIGAANGKRPASSLAP
mgnify:CR=1 FL=1